MTLMCILMNSIFCPAPTGDINPDSFRFSEALEAGCIPIVDAGRNYPSDGYYLEYFRRHPALAGDPTNFSDFILQVQNQAGWRAVPSLIAKMMTNVTLIQERQAAMIRWWQRFKDQLGRLVASRIRHLRSGSGSL